MRICLSLSRVHSRCAGKGCPHQSECWLRNRCTAAAIPQAGLRSAGKRRYRKEFGGILRSEQVRVDIGAAWQGWVKDGGRHAWQRRQRGRGKQWLKTEDGARWTDAEADQGVRLGVVPASE